MFPSGFGEPSGAQNLWSPGFVVVRLCMRINSVDTGPTSLTPERPRANERGSRPQEWPSARQGRCGSARATRRSPRRRGRWPRPSLSTGSTTARRRRQEAWGQPLCADGRTPCRARRSLSFRAHEGYTNTPAGTEEPQPPNRARGPCPGEATWGATLAVMSGTPRSSPFAARPRRRPFTRPRLRKEPADTFPTRNPDESAPQGCLRPRSARRTAACGPSEGSFPAHRQPHRPWVVRHRRKGLAHLSIRSRPAFPDVACLGISESRSRSTTARSSAWSTRRSPDELGEHKTPSWVHTNTPSATIGSAR